MANAVGGAVRFALKLEHLHPSRALKREQIESDAVALVMALDGHTDSQFVLQMVARPASESSDVGSMEIHLISTVTGLDGEPPKAERVDELCDDLLDVLGAPPLRWGFVEVDDADELATVLDPFPLTYLAEIARREEPCGPIRGDTNLGFVPAKVAPQVERDLWSMWTLGPAAKDMKRLAAVLLAQEDPVCIRVLVRPTSLTSEERADLERLVMQMNSSIPDGGLMRASLMTLEALLYLRPVFETRCLVASPALISRSMLSAVGQSMSEPSRHASVSAVQGRCVGRSGSRAARSDRYASWTKGASNSTRSSG